MPSSPDVVTAACRTCSRLTAGSLAPSAACAATPHQRSLLYSSHSGRQMSTVQPMLDA